MLSRLYDHLAWANDRALAALQDCATPPAKGVALMAHILGAEEVWLSRIEARQATLPVWPSLPLAEVAAQPAEPRERLAALAREADRDPAVANRPIHYTNSAGATFTSRLDDILAHVAIHGAYHRGQIALLVREQDDAPQATDFIVFARR